MMDNLISIATVYEAIFLTALVTGFPVIAAVSLGVSKYVENGLVSITTGIFGWGILLGIIWLLDFARLGETTGPALIISGTFAVLSLFPAYVIISREDIVEKRVLRRTVLTWPIILILMIGVQLLISGIATLISWSPPSDGQMMWFSGFILLSIVVGGLTGGLGVLVVRIRQNLSGTGGSESTDN